MSDNNEIKKTLEMIDAKLMHMEDIAADNRALIVKLIQQQNQIVKFLTEVEITDAELSEQFSFEKNLNVKNENKIKDINELIDFYLDKKESLIELEKELKKHKDKITPGTVGES
jgi:ribosome-associated translation inhibitor RaiA